MAAAAAGCGLIRGASLRAAETRADADASRRRLPNPFYAMDTAFQRPGMTPDQQLDLVRELGYAGVAWTHQTVEQDKANLAAIERRGLRMFTIYCAAGVSRGGVELPSDLPRLMAALKGHGTIVWLHIGGKATWPKLAKLRGNDAVVSSLRQAADCAAANDLRIAIYPHLGEWTQHFTDAIWVARLVDHPRFGVTFNLCHALAVGDEAKIPTMLEQAGDRLFTATLCGADSGVSGGNWDRLIQTLDKGTYDVAGLLQTLHALRFTGPIGFQGYGIKGDARSILTPTMRAWRRLSTRG